jgi:hypothetical protein
MAYIVYYRLMNYLALLLGQSFCHYVRIAKSSLGALADMT